MDVFDSARGRPRRTAGATDSRSPSVADSVAVGLRRRRPSDAFPSSSGIWPSLLFAAGFLLGGFFAASPFFFCFSAEALDTRVRVIFDKSAVALPLAVFAGERTDGRGS